MEKHRGVDFLGCRMSFGPRMADSALRLISKTGREALDIENDMVRILGLVDWVRAIASEPNMHPIRRRFNLNAVGSYLAA